MKDNTEKLGYDTIQYAPVTNSDVPRYMVSRRSGMSGNVNTMVLAVTEQQLTEFATGGSKGRFIQEIFPHLSPEEREFLKTGISPSEWEATFGPPDSA